MTEPDARPGEEGLHPPRMKYFSPLVGAGLLVALSPVVAGAFSMFGYAHNAWLQVGMAALAAWAIWPARQQSPVLSVSFAGVGLFVIGLSAWVSSLWATNGFLAVMAALHWQTVFICFVLVHSQIRGARDAQYVLRVLALSLLFVALVGLAQAFFKVQWVPQLSWYPASTFGNANMAAHYVVVLWPAVLGLLLISRKWYEQLFLALILLASWGYLAQTMSRAAVLASAVMVVAWFLVGLRALSSARLRGGMIGRTALLAGALALAAVLGANSVDSRGNNAFDRIGAEFARINFQDGLESADKARIPWFANTALMIADTFPLGVGAGNWQVDYPAYQNAALRDKGHGESNNSAHATHNDPLQLLAEFGIFGLAGLGLIATSFLGALRRIAGQPSQVAIMQLAAAIGLLGLSVNMQFSFPLQRTVVSCAAASLLAVLLWPVPQVASFAIPRRAAQLVSAALLALALALATYHVDGYLAWGHNRIADALARDGQAELALEHIDAAIRRDPLNPKHGLRKMLILDQLNDWRALSKEATGLLVVYPYRRSVLLGAIKAHLELEQPVKALPYAIRLANIAPMGFSGNETAGTVYGHLGRYEKACSYYSRAIENNSGHKSAEAMREYCEQ